MSASRAGTIPPRLGAVLLVAACTSAGNTSVGEPAAPPPSPALSADPSAFHQIVSPYSVWNSQDGIGVYVTVTGRQEFLVSGKASSTNAAGGPLSVILLVDGVQRATATGAANDDVTPVPVRGWNSAIVNLPVGLHTVRLVAGAATAPPTSLAFTVTITEIDPTW